MHITSVTGAENVGRAQSFTPSTTNTSAKKESVQMSTIKQHAVYLAAFLQVANPVHAEHKVPPAPDGSVVVMAGECTVDDTKDRGKCITVMTPEGFFLTAFFQNGEVMFIRKTSPGKDGYEEVYTSHDFNTF